MKSYINHEKKYNKNYYLRIKEHLDHKKIMSSMCFREVTLYRNYK